MSILLKDPYIEIFGLRIYFYAICIVIGMCLAIYLASKLIKKYGYNGDTIYEYAIFVILVGVLCARLYFYLFPYKGEVRDWSRFFFFKDGGLAIYGGLIGGGITAVIVALVKKQNIIRVLDSIAPGVMIAQAIGRWGNFFNEEAFGNIVTNESWQFFPYAVFIQNENAYYQATFFYESTWNILGAIAILLLMYKWKGFRVGSAFGGYALWYGIGRLWIEGLRSDSLYLIIGELETNIRISQLVSIIAILIGLVILSLCYISKMTPLLSSIESYVAPIKKENEESNQENLDTEDGNNSIEEDENQNNENCIVTDDTECSENCSESNERQNNENNIGSNDGDISDKN